MQATLYTCIEVRIEYSSNRRGQIYEKMMTFMIFTVVGWIESHNVLMNAFTRFNVGLFIKELLRVSDSLEIELTALC